MAKLTKKQKEALSKVEKRKIHITLKKGSALVKEVNTAKFDASVDIAVSIRSRSKKSKSIGKRGSVTSSRNW